MPKDEAFYRQILSDKEIPILVLDHEWHKLFTQTGNYESIKNLEAELNELLKLQGKYNTELKSLTSYKKQLMQEIVSIMELPDSPEKEKKMDANKKSIEDTNQKLEEYRDLQLDLPRLTKEKNMQLMMATLEVCYDKIKNNNSEIEEINKWINDFRDELKKKVLLKQKKQIINDEMYNYMHAIFGPEVIEMFDLKYNPHINKKSDDTNTENI